MEMDKNNRMNSLFEFYAPLLTTKQHSYLEMYYGDDFSLGEIAADFKISRQAVYDNIRRTEKILETYETKLHLLEHFELQNKQVDALQKYAQQAYPADTTLQELVTQVEQISEQ